MIAPFEASTIKIERAQKHLQELKDAIAVYLDSKPCVLLVEPFPGLDLSSKTHAWIVRVRQPVPLIFSAIIGDVVHNLRASLDVLVSDLVRVNGKSASGVHFPFAESAAELPDAIRRWHIRRAGGDIVTAIENLQPYKGCNVGLRAMHDMDIADKHQALLPTLSAVNLPLATITFGGNTIPLPHFATTVTNDGQVVMGYPAAANLPLGTEIPTQLLLVFGQVLAEGGREVIQTLLDFTHATDRVVKTLSALRPGAVFPIVDATGRN